MIEAIRKPAPNPFAVKTEDPESPFGYRNLTVSLAVSKRAGKVAMQGYQLRERLTFAEMIEAAGGEEVVRKYHARTKDQIRAIVDRQKNGEAGPLLVNGYANFFFALAEDGSLAVVGVVWHSDSRRWDVWSGPASSSYQWNSFRRLFLRAV